jgi:predicted nucleotide-binding protein
LGAGPRKRSSFHGHNATLKYEIAHTLQNAGLDVTILHEQTNQGRTLLEKFADHAAEAGFAVVLLTADDVGSAGGVSMHEPLQPRARQNVVFELGFFFGLLGRGRVCAVYEKGVELPSDLQGLARVEHDSAGRWKHDVAKEIHAAGILVDFSKL